MRTLEDMVRQEIVYCVSGLIHTLATEGEGPLWEQATELFSPVLDYESPAREAAELHENKIANKGFFFVAIGERDDAPLTHATVEEAAREYCDAEGIEPDEREIYEHWIVSDWLAEKLEEKGERIDSDFAGLTVWGRTTTGQGIAMDSVIAEIYADVEREYREMMAELDAARESNR